MTAHLFKKTLRTFNKGIPNLLNNYNTAKLHPKSISWINQKIKNSQTSKITIKDENQNLHYNSSIISEYPKENIVFNNKTNDKLVNIVNHVFKGEKKNVENVG